MSILTPIPPRTPWPQRLFYSLPLIGWIARDVAFRERDNIWYALVILATVWLLAIVEWGIVAVVVPYVFAVPFIVAALVRITWV